MVIEYAVAAMVSLPAALIFDDHEDMPYWMRWDPAAVWTMYGMLGLLCAVTGLAVTALAQHLGWTLNSGSGQDWANGALYGAAAAALLRLEVTTFGLSPVSPARVLFKQLLKRFGKWLDEGCARAVPRRIGDLNPTQLCLVSWTVFERHVRPRLRHVTSWRHANRLKASQTRALATNPADQVGAMGAQQELRHYVAERIVANKDSTIDLQEE